MDDPDLLRRYLDEQSEAAFAELVQRHLALVYFAALRQVGGNAALAQDVSQLVFTDLARKARALTGRATLTGWLYTSTRFAAAKALRSERRRRAREQEAVIMHETLGSADAANWERVRPAIDDALHTLDEDDREAVLLRFFEGRAFGEIARALQLTEDGARKRVARSLDRLAVELSRRGISSTSAALAAAVSTQAGAMPPADLAAAIARAALESASAAGTHGVAGALRPGVMSLGIAAAVLVGGAVYQTLVATDAASSVSPAVERRDAARARASEGAQRVAAAREQRTAAEEDNARLRTAIETASLAAIVKKDASRIAFVIDTSGSMRDPKSGGLHAVVVDTVEEILAGRPELPFFQLFDGDGRVVISDTAGKWLPNDAAGRDAARQALRRYDRDSVSNPVPGVERALEALDAARDPLSRLQVYILGDEFIERQDKVLAQLEVLNPADSRGRRRISISAVAFPTWRAFARPARVETREVIAPGRTIHRASPVAESEPLPEPPNTFVKYERLMRELARRHGGTFTTAAVWPSP